MLDKKEKLFLVMLFLMLIVLIGASLNFIVKKNNNCLMPVRSNYLYEGDDNHFFFQEPEDVNYHYLSDIMSYQVGTKIHFFSVGDLVMVLGAIGFIICSILYLKIKYKEMNLVKNVD